MTTVQSQYNIPKRQQNYQLGGLKNEWLSFPSSSPCTFNGNSSFFVRNSGGILLHSVSLVLTLSAPSGLTGTATNYPVVNSGFFFFSKIEPNIAGTPIQQQGSAGLGQYVLHNILFSDEQRALIETQTGPHANISLRNAKTTAGDTWIVPVRGFWSEASYAILSATQEVEIKVNFDSITNFLSQSTLTGSPSITITNATLLCYVSRLPKETWKSELAILEKQPRHQRYHREIWTQQPIASGSTSTTITLSQFNGANFDLIWFVVRPQSSITGENATKFTKISSFSIADSTGTSLVGTNAITHQQMIAMSARRLCASSLLAEDALGTWASNVYAWSPSTNPLQGMLDGLHLTSHYFSGTETLTINFPSALGSACFVDIFGYAITILETSASGVKIYPAKNP